jgi:hypothetical protein
VTIRDALATTTPALDGPTRLVGCTRDDLAVYLCDERCVRGAEIGVFKGEYAETLCQRNPGLTLLAIDPWMPYEGYVDQRRSTMAKLPTLYDMALARLARYPVDVIRKTSMDAATSVPDRSLDFVFIDGNHALPYVLDDLVVWSRKVRRLGIVAGHDYHRFERKPYTAIQVIEAVDQFTHQRQIVPWFLLDDGSYFWYNL